MARPTVPTEVKQARGTYRKPLSEECAHAFRRKSKARTFAIAGVISGDVLAAYEEAIDFTEERTPHIDDSHGMPAADDLAEIEQVEQIMNAHLPDELQLKAGMLFRMILDAR